jgi:hypothetical protein
MKTLISLRRMAGTEARRDHRRRIEHRVRPWPPGGIIPAGVLTINALWRV